MLIELIQISVHSDTNTEVPRSSSAAVAGHSCPPPNPHFVLRPILISFSHVLLLVFLNSTFIIFLNAYFSVVLMPDSEIGSGYYDYFRNRPRTVLLVEEKTLYRIILGETAVHKLMDRGH